MVDQKENEYETTQLIGQESPGAGNKNGPCDVCVCVCMRCVRGGHQ